MPKKMEASVASAVQEEKLTTDAGGSPGTREVAGWIGIKSDKGQNGKGKNGKTKMSRIS
jgi:hypothetical protein